MGSVAVTFRLMPESPDTDLAAIRNAVKGALGPAFRGTQEKDIAFGLKALLVLAVVEDAAGASDRVEAKLAAIPGVGSVEAIDVTLV
jgi:elongation factor 1-beta